MITKEERLKEFKKNNPNFFKSKVEESKERRKLEAIERKKEREKEREKRGLFIIELLKSKTDIKVIRDKVNLSLVGLKKEITRIGVDDLFYSYNRKNKRRKKITN